MGGYELIAVVVFFLVGYWLVDYFWPKKKPDAPPAPAPGQGAPADEAPWHEVLGVSPDADAEQIRKAYEAKSAQYQLDRAMTRQINDAFEAAMRARS